VKRLLRVNLGCGNKPLPGFVNLDLLDVPGVDVVADVSGPLPFETGSVDLLYASHVLEHLPHNRIPSVLKEWRRVLAPGGRLLVAVPDLQLIARMLIEREGWFTPPHEPWIGALYGGQKDEFDFHHTGFTGPWLTALLVDAGFGTITRTERFREIGSNDGSWALAPFGLNVSLNMEAIVGDEAAYAPLLKPSWFEPVFGHVDGALAFALRGSAAVRAKLMRRRLRALKRAVRDES
jgi:SAM-dependent methyltransferase